jgi:DNA-binding Lrp family transcriptional regulator
MTCAYSLISVDPAKTEEALLKIKKIKEVKTVKRVAGPYDIIARIEVGELEHLTKVIFDCLRSIPGVVNTTTLIVMEE